MRVNSPIVRTTLALLLAGATLRGDTRAIKPFVPIFLKTPISAGTTPTQKPTVTRINSRSHLSEIQKIECYTSFKETAMQAQEFGLFSSEAWKDFNDLMSPLSNRELIGFATIGSNNSDLLQCVLTYDELKTPLSPFSNHRNMMLFAAFFNLVGFNIQQSTQIDFKKGTRETSISIAPLHLDQNVIREKMGIIKRLSANLSDDSPVFILYQPSMFMWAENSRMIRPDFEERLKSYGKWEILAGSLDEAETFTAAILPYIESGDIAALKFDTKPHVIDGSDKVVHRVICYTHDHNPRVKRILEQISKKVLWVYEWQTFDSFLLYKALSIFHSSAKALSDEEEQELVARLKDKKLMRSLGLSNFQVQMLEETLRVSKPDAEIDFGNAVTYSTFETVRATNNTAIGLVAEALKPKNQADFKAHLEKSRQAGASSILDR